MDQFEKFLDGFFLGDVFLDTFLRLVERDLTTTSSYISVIGIGHLTGTVRCLSSVPRDPSWLP